MRYIVPAVLLGVAIIHALPVVGVLGAPRLMQLYGFPVTDVNLELVLRHRAVLFGLLAALLAYAAFVPSLHGLALVAGFVSVASFLLLMALVGPVNPALTTVARVDGVALGLLLAGAVAHVLQRR